jgi:hypothetical protein
MTSLLHLLQQIHIHYSGLFQDNFYCVLDNNCRNGYHNRYNILIVYKNYPKFSKMFSYNCCNGSHIRYIKSEQKNYN